MSVCSLVQPGVKKKDVSSVCVCVCVCCMERFFQIRNLFFLFVLVFLGGGPGGVVVNSNRRIQLFAHRVLESTFAASLCNLSSIFEKYLFL